jgi:hypothetical protein
MSKPNLSVRQTIETLVELSRESSDMIVWALAELLDRLAKVCKASLLTKLFWLTHVRIENAFEYRSSPIAALYRESAVHYRGLSLESELCLCSSR